CSTGNQKQTDLVVVSGGVGVTDRQGLQTLPPTHNLQLIFRQKPRGNYLAAVDVMLVEEKGKAVLHAISDGPWFYANLPPGRYYVLAAADGRELEKTVKVGGATAKVSMVWPQSSGKHRSRADQSAGTRQHLPEKSD